MGKGGTYHSVNTTTVAGLDQQTHVSIHKRHSHGDGRTVRQNKVGVLAEPLDKREDVVPATAVETGAVVTQFVDDLVHLKSSSDGLNQHGTPDSTPGHANVVLRQVEHVVPQTSLEVRLHLGQVEVRTKATSHQLLGVVVEVQAKVEQTARDGLAVNHKVLLLQVPATRTGNQRRQRPVRPQLVFLATLLEVDLTTDSIVQVHLAANHVLPGGGTRVYTTLAAIHQSDHQRPRKKNIPSKSAM